jgi:hypothetical protein
MSPAIVDIVNLLPTESCMIIVIESIFIKRKKNDPSSIEI